MWMRVARKGEPKEGDGGGDGDGVFCIMISDDIRQ